MEVDTTPYPAFIHIPDRSDSSGNTPLLIAALEGMYVYSISLMHIGDTATITRLIEEEDVPIDEQSATGQSILHMGVLANNKAIIELAFEYGASPLIRDMDMCTPLHLAAEIGCVAIAEILLNHGASVYDTNINKDTPLHIAVCGDSLEMVILLLAHHGSLYMQNADGKHQ